jgi:hypothetical protein
MVNLIQRAGVALLSVGLLFPAAIPAATAADLSQYRGFRFGEDIATVAKRANTNATQVSVIQKRPVVIQEVEWRPQSLGGSAKSEAAKQVIFSFFGGELFRIAVEYDRYETEGMTVDDFVEAISATYGAAERPNLLSTTAPRNYGDQEEILAQWQDPQYSFDFIRSSYGPTYRLVGTLKRLDAQVRASMIEAKKLDDQEAPQREASRLLREEETAKSKASKSRLENKPKFRP